MNAEKRDFLISLRPGDLQNAFTTPIKQPPAASPEMLPTTVFKLLSVQGGFQTNENGSAAALLFLRLRIARGPDGFHEPGDRAF